MVQALFQKFNILNLGAKPESLTKGGFDEVFVGVSFPRVPVTLSIIIYCFESPATTFGLVNHIRLAAIYTTIVKILVLHLLF